MSKRKFFDSQAECWDRQYHQDHVSQIEELVDRFNLEEGKTVLDVGCGTGILLPYLSEKAKEKGVIFALDFSWNMIFRAKKNKQEPHIHFINASAEALPLRDQTIDYITCFATFAHVTGQKKTICEMGRALKKGGKLFIAHLLGKKELAEHHRLAGGVVGDDTLPEDEEMGNIMKNAGLENIEIIDQPNLYLASAKK